MKKTIKTQFLTSFFNLFGAEVKITKVDGNNVIYGTLSWKGEDDKQDFKWSNYFNKEALIILKKTCDFILKNNLNKGDRILISENVLRKKLIKYGWTYGDAEKGIEYLMLINIKMIDDGEETDSFFFHF